MFGPLGVPEIIFLLVLALLIFGPRKLPQIGRTLGRGMAEFRKASTELRRALNTDELQEDLRASDPRRIVREELSRPFKASEETAAEAAEETAAEAAEETAAETSGEPAAPSGEPEPSGEPTSEEPAATVARGEPEDESGGDGAEEPSKPTATSTETP